MFALRIRTGEGWSFDYADTVQELLDVFLELEKESEIYIAEILDSFGTILRNLTPVTVALE
ncbi:MAG: hypothetical protein HOE80_04390 [Candidatus Magasanikbacteria bacterium]|jgi:hypothetical protein|nr:hypothetical protein [Candidatus Magasanikbacteria bacterium]MBT4071931.1 hypothetical protein [Candidatus Magasanikbacteria bacterium]